MISVLILYGLYVPWGRRPEKLYMSNYQRLAGHLGRTLVFYLQDLLLK